MSLASTLKLENDVVSARDHIMSIASYPFAHAPYRQFVAFACSLLLLSLKMTFIAWHTVYFMVMHEKGMRNKEDLSTSEEFDAQSNGSQTNLAPTSRRPLQQGPQARGHRPFRAHGQAPQDDGPRHRGKCREKRESRDDTRNS